MNNKSSIGEFMQATRFKTANNEAPFKLHCILRISL